MHSADDRIPIVLRHAPRADHSSVTLTVESSERRRCRVQVDTRRCSTSRRILPEKEECTSPGLEDD